MADSLLEDLSALTEVSDDDLLYIRDAPGGTPASKKITVADFLKRSRLTLTAKTANYTAVDGDLVVCDLTTASFTVTLPAVADNARIGIKLGTGSGTRTVTIDPDGTDEIDGQTSIILYIENDYIELQGNATDGQWVVVQDGVQGHVAKMYNTAAQTLTTSGTAYLLEYNTLLYDNVGLASLSDESMTIRRGGIYTIESAVYLGGVLDAGERLTLSLFVNGTLFAIHGNGAGAANQTMTTLISFTDNFSAGDVLTVNVTQNEGASQTLTAIQGTYPYLTVTEQRGGGHGSGGAIPLNSVFLSTANGKGSTNTGVMRYTTNATDGTALTATDSSTLGGYITVNEPGLYAIIVTGQDTAASCQIGATVNNTTSPITGGSFADTTVGVYWIGGNTAFSNAALAVSGERRLSTGDIIRAHHTGTSPSNSFYGHCNIRVTKTGN